MVTAVTSLGATPCFADRHTKGRYLIVRLGISAGGSLLWAASVLAAVMLSVSACAGATKFPGARDGGLTAAAGHRTTRLGLHVTQEELDIWRQRAASGPYKSTGDVSANSPGDWDRIKAHADRFLNNPSTGGWDAWTGEWGVYPGVLFMFGQLEGKVRPYPRASRQSQKR